MEDGTFTANVITIPAIIDVLVLIHNTDDAPQNFTINDRHNTDVENLNIDLTVDPGQIGTVVITAPAGTYYFYSTATGDEAAGMFGYLIAEEGATVATEDATVKPPVSE